MILAPPHKKHPLVDTFDRRKSHYGKTDEWKDFVQVTGGGNCTLAAAREAMGIDWMTKGEINESIPPAYTEFVGQQLLLQECGYGKGRFQEENQGFCVLGLVRLSVRSKFAMPRAQLSANGQDAFESCVSKRVGKFSRITMRLT